MVIIYYSLRVGYNRMDKRNSYISDYSLWNTFTEIKRYKKVQEYLLTLSDSELDSIAHAFENESFEKISTTEIVKKLIKISPKALLKLGKFI